MKAPAVMVATAKNVPNHLRFNAALPPSRWYVSCSQKKPATPYVYQDAKSDPVIPTRSEKIGTALARTNEMALAVKHRPIHTDQPRTVCMDTCRVRRNIRMNTNLAAACVHRDPALWEDK